MSKFYRLFGIVIVIGIASCGDDDDDDSPSGDNRLPNSVKEEFGFRYMSSVLADFDGDDDLDLLLGSIDGDENPQDKLLINNGSGRFSSAPDENIPPRFGGASYGTVQLRAADVDGDGDMDALAAVHSPLPSTDASVMLYLNDGSGVFSDGSNQIDYITPNKGSEHTIGRLESGDLDLDGDTDFIVVHGFGSTDNSIYLNDGNGNFAYERYEGLYPNNGGFIDEVAFGQAFDVHIGDVNNDQFPDIVSLPSVGIFNGIDNYELKSEFQGFYQPMFGAALKNAAGGNAIIVGVQFVFLDEGGAEIVAFNLDENDSLINASNEVLSFTRNTIHPRNLYIADFDGNGTEDLIIADHGFDNFPFPGAQNTLLLQQADGTLTDASNRLPQVSDFTHDMAIGDIDNDGDIDIYAANLQLPDDGVGASQVPYFMINDGSGRFSLEE